jgi:outer membrane immunogenic protein
MRHLAAIAVMLLMSADITLAADLPRPGPAFIPTPIHAGYDWTGFYLGANVGGGWANTKSDFSVGGNPAFASANNSLAGALGGVQVGYNWQRGPAVFGLETDFQFSSLSGRIDAPPCPAAICGVDVSASYSQKIPWFGTVRGRVGYAADTWLIYATGGYAYTRLQTDAVASAGAAATKPVPD